MESTFSAAYVMGAVFLLGSAGLTIAMLAYSIWGLISGKGLAPLPAAVGGVAIEGVDILTDGEPEAPVNTNAKRAPKRGKAA